MKRAYKERTMGRGEKTTLTFNTGRDKNQSVCQVCGKAFNGRSIPFIRKLMTIHMQKTHSITVLTATVERRDDKTKCAKYDPRVDNF